MAGNNLLSSLKPLPATVEDLDTEDIPKMIWISRHLHSRDAQGNSEIGREPGLVSITVREQVFLGQISLILPDIHVVKLGGVAGLYLDLLGHFPAGVDPVALESAKDAIETALFNPEQVFESLNHLPMGMRIFQMHVERGRIGGVDPFKSSLAIHSSTQPLKLESKIHMLSSSSDGLEMEPAFYQGYFITGRRG